MYRTAMLPSYCDAGLAVAVGLDPARLVRKLAQAQQLRGVQRNGVGVTQLVVGPLVLPVAHPLIGGAVAGGLQARRLRGVAQREEHQRDDQHHAQRRQEPLPADQRVPADRSADRRPTAPRRSRRCGWAGRDRRGCAGLRPAEPAKTRAGRAGDTVDASGSGDTVDRSVPPSSVTADRSRGRRRSGSSRRAHRVTGAVRPVRAEREARWSAGRTGS